MITEGWFIREVLGKCVVPNSEVCSQFQKTNWEQNESAKNLMDKRSFEFVPNVPIVPKEKESPCDLVEEGDDVTIVLGSPLRLVVSLPHAMTDTDDRVLCGDCAHLSRDGHCQKWSIVNPHNSRYRPVKDVLRRCSVFAANQS